jgi:hypothetical protein
VGWITNFIHNRNTVNMTMLRGWSASTFSNAVDRELVRTIEGRLQARGCKRATRGFLLDENARVAQKRKVTMKGSGDVGYTAHNKNSRWINPALKIKHPITGADTAQQVYRGLNTAIMDHAGELGLRVPHQLSNRVRQLTGGVHINGRPWKRGAHCFFYRRDDRAINAPIRVAIVDSFVIVQIGIREHMFLRLDQRRIEDIHKSLRAFDVLRPPHFIYSHVDHVTDLVGSVPFWSPGRPDLRVGVIIAPTV